MELTELSLHAGINRIEDAQAVKADTIVAAFSFCDWNLDRAEKSMESDVKALDITVMPADSVGL